MIQIAIFFAVVFAAGCAHSSFDVAAYSKGDLARSLTIVGDGVTDDTAAINAAISSDGIVVLPRGTFLTTGPLLITASGQGIVGLSRGLSRIVSSSSGPAIAVSASLDHVTLKAFTVTRAASGATSGQDGIQFAGYTQFAKLEDIESSNHFVGFNFGSTSYSYCHDLFADNNTSDGILATNDAVPSLQWTLSKCLSQRNGGYGYRYATNPLHGPVTCGELISISTFGNLLGGALFQGSATAGLNAVRWSNGFVGQDGGHGITLDTYGSSTHKIQGVFCELAGTSACGVNLSTPPTGQGVGIYVTTANTDVSLVGNVVLGNSWNGIECGSTFALITGNECRLNGAAGFPGETSGIFIPLGAATISGNACRGQDFGLFLQADNHAIAGNDFRFNTLGGIACAVPLASLTSNQGFP